MSSLFEVVRSKDLSFIKEFFKEGNYDINKRYEDNITCLHLAAGLDDVTILEYLLEQGADVNCVTSDGLTPLQIAAMWGKNKHIDILLSYGAIHSLKDNTGYDAHMHHTLYYQDSEVFHTACCSPEQVETQGLNLEKLDGSPWVTPRGKRRSKNARLRKVKFLDESVAATANPGIDHTSQSSPQRVLRKKQTTNYSSQFSPESLTEEGKPTNADEDKHYCTANELDMDSFMNSEFYKHYMTEISSDLVSHSGSSTHSNSPSFSYSTISCVETERLYFVQNDDVSLDIEHLDRLSILTENSTSEDEGESMEIAEKANIIKHEEWEEIRGEGEEKEHEEEEKEEKKEDWGENGKRRGREEEEGGGGEEEGNGGEEETEGEMVGAGGEEKEEEKKEEQIEDEEIEEQEQERKREKKIEGEMAGEEKEKAEGEEEREEEIEEERQERNGRKEMEGGMVGEEKEEEEEIGSGIERERNENEDNSTLSSTFVVKSSNDNLGKKPTNFFVPFQSHIVSSNSIPSAKDNLCHSDSSKERKPEQTVYDWKDCSTIEPNDESKVSIPESFKLLTNEEIKKRIMSFGQTPGPITAYTKHLYLKKLWKLEQGLGGKNAKNDSPFQQYPPELRMILTGRSVIPSDCCCLEEQMMEEFCSKKNQWRGGSEKSSFNYLLLDPRVTCNLPVRHKILSKTEAFRCFILSIFYVGKGKRSRPYAHLHEAVKSHKTNKKLAQIWDIWGSGLGVISLHLFQSAIQVEAFTREACMVDALGLSQLTNQKRGEYYGTCGRLPIRKKRNLGVFLLYKALKIFLQEGERQISKEDI